MALNLIIFIFASIIILAGVILLIYGQSQPKKRNNSQSSIEWDNSQPEEDQEMIEFKKTDTVENYDPNNNLKRQVDDIEKAPNIIAMAINGWKAKIQTQKQVEIVERHLEFNISFNEKLAKVYRAQKESERAQQELEIVTDPELQNLEVEKLRFEAREELDIASDTDLQKLTRENARLKQKVEIAASRAKIRELNKIGKELKEEKKEESKAEENIQLTREEKIRIQIEERLWNHMETKRTVYSTTKEILEEISREKQSYFENIDQNQKLSENEKEEEKYRIAAIYSQLAEEVQNESVRSLRRKAGGY